MKSVIQSDSIVLGIFSAFLGFIIFEVYNLGTIYSTILGTIILICSLAVFITFLGSIGLLDLGKD